MCTPTSAVIYASQNIFHLACSCCTRDSITIPVEPIIKDTIFREHEDEEWLEINSIAPLEVPHRLLLKIVYRKYAPGYRIDKKPFVRCMQYYVLDLSSWWTNTANNTEG